MIPLFNEEQPTLEGGLLECEPQQGRLAVLL